MKSLSFKTKILFLVIAPLVLVSVVLTLLAIYEAKQLGGQNIESFSQKMFDLRRGELKNYTELAETAVKHIYEDVTLDPLSAQIQAKEILRNMSYGDDGYFFVFDFDALTVVHPAKPHLEGKNLWDIRDPQGVYVIRELIDKAQKGGGFTHYQWDKPSKGREVDKISHSRGLDQWQWMFGTGLYVDDIEEAVDTVEHEVEANITQTWSLVASLAVACTLIVGFIGARFTMSEGNLADQKLQQLSRKNVEVQEAERSRVSRQLQSGINQSLVAARAKLQKVAKSESLHEPTTKEDFVAAVNILNKTIKEVYRISGELRPSVLDKMGLYAAVEALTTELSEKEGLKVSFKKVDVDERLKPEAETALYRIIQEALNNITLHSQASTASVRMRQANNELSVTIQDNGIGFDTRKMMGKGNKAGIGIIDMRVRAESLGGAFTVFSSEGTGTMLKVDVPV